MFWHLTKHAEGLHSGRLTWNLQITHLERNMIFQTSMIMFYANLKGCRIPKELDLILLNLVKIKYCETEGNMSAKFSTPWLLTRADPI